MKGGEGRRPAGRELMSKIRFGVMAQVYLECKVREALPEKDWELTDGLIVEALKARGALRTPEVASHAGEAGGELRKAPIRVWSMTR
jgi:hypothetical protein